MQAQHEEVAAVSSIKLAGLQHLAVSCCRPQQASKEVVSSICFKKDAVLHEPQFFLLVKGGGGDP